MTINITIIPTLRGRSQTINDRTNNCIMTSSDYILSWYIRVLQKNRTRPNSMYWLTRGVGLQDYGG